ncbi:hypothetical protein KR067_008014 [Drosophila pandora]|nr:hypothetical protein KR067_008014 [Drosophila pandora]
MQYRACARFLPSSWVFARNLLIVASSTAFVTSCSSFADTRPLAGISASKMSSNAKTCKSSCPGTPYQAGSSSVAYVTTPDQESAKKLARGIIERKLAACVNIVPQIESIYMWEGKVNEDSEYLLMIKTRTQQVDELSKYVRENHPYSVAEVISLPIQNGNPPYLKWIEQTVPDKPEKTD